MKVFKVLFAAILVVSLVSCNSQGVTKKSLDNDVDSVSYALGLDMGLKVKTNFAEIEKELFVQGFRNGLDSTDIKLDPKTIGQVLNGFFQKKQQEDQEKARKEAEKKAEEQFREVKEAGEKFLEENKTKANVKVTESGLQYIVLKEGSGDKPSSGSKVEVMTPDRTFSPEIMAMNLTPYMRSLQKKDVTFTVTHRLLDVMLTGNKLTAKIGTDYSEYVEEKKYDQIIVNYGTMPLDDLYFELKPKSKNYGAVDYDALINGDVQKITKNKSGKFQLFRIGDAVSSRNTHAAIYDALRLVKDL